MEKSLEELAAEFRTALAAEEQALQAAKEARDAATRANHAFGVCQNATRDALDAIHLLLGVPEE